MRSEQPVIPTFKEAIVGFDEKAFGRALLAAESIITPFKDAIDAINRHLDMRFHEGENIRKLIRARAHMTDCLIHYAWHQFTWDDDISLVAVGGYGRGELHPKSDIDLLILMGNENTHKHSHNIEQLLTLLWDIGLEIGHSARTLNQCVSIANSDITVATNLMEARVLQGDKALLHTLTEKTAPQHMWANDAFFRAKIREQDDRHAKYNNIEYNLEPNIKNAPGGLRDIQTIKWVAKRFFSVSTFEKLNQTGLFTEKEYAILSDGEEFLWRVRYGLHLLANRPEERLLFEYQRELAELFGYQDTEEALAIEQFMHRYYRVVLALRELNDVLLQFLDEAIIKLDQAIEITPINERFQLRNTYIEVTHPNVFVENPSALLEIFVLLGQNKSITGIRALTIRLIRESRYLIDESFCKNPVNNQLFMALLRSPYRLVTQLKRMVRYGVLGLYLPEFGRIIGQMQHDLFHIYTVDAHTLNLIRFMRRFLLEEKNDRYPLACEIIKQVSNLELLYSAGLYHDIAKGRGGDHSLLGAVDVTHFCLQHSFTAREARTAAWLVENHLLMSSISQKQDLSDPQVIHEFALTVGDQKRLDYLYVLTVADMNATNPDIWNGWRASLMSELYVQTKRALRRGLENPVDKYELIDDTQQAAMKKLVDNGHVDEQSAWELWQTVDEDYFLRETASDIAWQTEAILAHHNAEKPLIIITDIDIQGTHSVTKIFIRAKLKQNIFAATTTILDQLNMNIQSAQIHSATSSGFTMDTFYVLDQDDLPIGGNPEIAKQVVELLQEEFSISDEYSDIIRRRIPRQLKHFASPTRTSIHNDISNEHTVLEVISPDRPGFLARLARVFVEYDIELVTAKITTLGERVEDMFFITDKEGNRLSDPNLCEELQQAICTQLDAKNLY
ncbi:[protein-PII] uridylyltransferase [Eionea flava]